jgi:hypothetical protein
VQAASYRPTLNEYTQNLVNPPTGHQGIDDLFRITKQTDRWGKAHTFTDEVAPGVDPADLARHVEEHNIHASSSSGLPASW